LRFPKAVKPNPTGKTGEKKNPTSIGTDNVENSSLLAA
jgi:hypothetical protein